ncbi:uncharacterized protein LAJ45_07242 [Morchella importuna]|uniref:uncharacterized protein n=1 Tax=Morchella importuna TaxID=1174673 RepID=UPI001E8D592D|nr:uncharacterized protein LAJ45_07242 [Morchella importuna]KAH8148531.1 hypothetical protein LAJ45_07242 [Morchella importuna]
MNLQNLILEPLEGIAEERSATKTFIADIQNERRLTDASYSKIIDEYKFTISTLHAQHARIREAYQSTLSALQSQQVIMNECMSVLSTLQSQDARIKILEEEGILREYFQ